MRPAIPFDRATEASNAQPAQQETGAPQRARGRALLSVKRRGTASVIDDLHMSGSSKLLFPRMMQPGDAPLEAVILNSAGGVTGGDDFSLSFSLAPGARMRVTTQAAERIYRASPLSPSGRVTTALELGAGATLMWLPQETILFDGANLRRSLSVNMTGDARFLSCEALLFGRALMGETLGEVRLRDHVDLRRDGALVFADRLRLDGDAHEQLSRAAVAQGAGAMASVVLAEPEAERHVERLRDELPQTVGISAPVPGLVFLRMLAEDGFALRKTLVPLLRDFAGGALPRPWML